MSKVIYVGEQGPVNGSSAPAYTWRYAVQSNTVDVTPAVAGGENVCRGFRALADGDVSVVTVADEIITLPVLRGDIWIGYIRRIRDTDTTLLNSQIVLIY